MGRGIAIDERAVAGRGEDHAVPDDHGPDRHLTAERRGPRLGESPAQGIASTRIPQSTLPFRAPSCYHARMTDTTKPPDRPKSPRPPRPHARKDETLARTGDTPRSRPGNKRDDGRSSRPSPRHAEPTPREDDARIAKVMARAGLCSRRDAESWIAAGRVAVNGTVIDSPALNVKAQDVITVDGMPLPDREPTRLFMFHKPRGLVTTSRDPEGRPTIFENLPEGLPRVVSVGRLDINTEGLMLLTNDGGLARVLELPATGWLRRYRVRANGEIDQARLDTLKTGITIDGVDYAGIEATLDRIQGSNAWLTMGLREGKNREIKRVLETLGLAVTRLIRISFGPFQLGDLAEGAVESVPARVLRDQLGPSLAAEAGIVLVEAEDRAPGPAGRVKPEPLVEARSSRASPASPRAHVSALRAARDAAAQDGRHRIERSATADRKGRAVKVERVVPVGPGRSGGESRKGGESRNARRFAEGPAEAATGRRKAPASKAEGGGETRSPVRRERASGFGDRPRGERAGGFGDKPRGERASGFGDKPRGERAGGFGDKPRGERAGGFGDKPRGERAGGFGDKPRGERAGGFGDKPRGERAGGFGDKPRGERAGFNDKPRGERAGGFSDKPRGERASGFGDKPRGERAGGFGDKPRGERAGGKAGGRASASPGKPGGRAGGFGSERPATGRNRPAGGGRPPSKGPAGSGRPKGGGPPRGGSRPPRS